MAETRGTPVAESRYDVRNPDGAEFRGVPTSAVCAAIVEGTIDLGALATPADTDDYRPITQYEAFRAAFETRMGLSSHNPRGSDVTPPSLPGTTGLVDDLADDLLAPEPPTEARVPVATQALVPAHGSIPDVDTSPEHETAGDRFVAGGLDPDQMQDPLADTTRGGGLLAKDLGLGLDEDSEDDAGAATMPTAQALDHGFDDDDDEIEDGADTLIGQSLDEPNPENLFSADVVDVDSDPGAAPLSGTAFAVMTDDEEEDGEDPLAVTAFSTDADETAEPLGVTVLGGQAEVVPDDDEATQDGDTLFGGPPAHEEPTDDRAPAATLVHPRVAESRPATEVVRERKRDTSETVAMQRTEPQAPVTEAPSASDTVAMARAPSDTMTGSAPAVDLSMGDIDEVAPNDTQIAVVMPDESFEPEDLALASSDNPLPSRVHPPAETGAIGHGIAMPRTPTRAKDERRVMRLLIAMGAWAVIFGVLFAASIVTGGGRAEAQLLPSSAALWLRIALTGGLGGVLVFAFRHSMPIGKRAFSITPSWAAIAVLAGTCVGAMAPAIAPTSPVAVAVVLAATVAIAEEIFFRGFLGRSLAAAFSGSRLPTALAAVLYGVYYATYFVIWQHPSPLQVGLALTMITVGAGLPYALLHDLTKGFLAPLLCHVSLNIVAVLVRALL